VFAKVENLTEKLIPNLKMYCFNTTLIGVLKGVADYFGMPLSNPWLFGGSGHAFLINIHEQLCPSGPYCWNFETFLKLVRNLGIEITNLGFFSAKSTPEERRKVEATLRESIDAGTPCSLLNMENQLIAGYNDERFIVQQPWPMMDFPPKTLTFETWKELGDEVHIDFFTFAQREKASDEVIVKDSLNAAIDIARNPERWRQEHYYVGLQAYDAWIKAIEDGFGASHGNWWNGTVWCECKQMASGYFTEIASKHRAKISKKAMELSNQYKDLAELLDKARDKQLASNEKIEVLQKARKTEASCINEIEELLKILG